MKSGEHSRLLPDSINIQQREERIMDMKPDTIVLFENEKDGNDKRPDLTGTALWNGEEIKVALWENVSKGGKKYLSGQLQRPYNGAGVSGDVNRSAEGTDIPF